MARKTDNDKPTTSRPTSRPTSRRGFFRVGLFGAGAAGALAVVTRATGVAAAPAVKSAGYRVTEHVKKVYALSRF